MSAGPGHDARRRFTVMTSIALIVLGIAMIARTLAGGGGALAVGLLLGLLFIAAGAGRIWVARAGRRGR